MRLWHQSLISKLPNQQLLGQHRECCALRGKGWGRNHSTVNYVFEHSIYKLYKYHIKIMDEMHLRGYKCDKIWLDYTYRGKILGYDSKVNIEYGISDVIYSEHDERYLEDCLTNLKKKGVFVEL